MFFKKEVTEIGTPKLIGRVRNFYPRLSVAAIKLSGVLSVGDKIRIEGGNANFSQTVESMELNKEKINQGNTHDLIGLEVENVVREGYKIFLLEE